MTTKLEEARREYNHGEMYDALGLLIAHLEEREVRGVWCLNASCLAFTESVDGRCRKCGSPDTAETEPEPSPEPAPVAEPSDRELGRLVHRAIDEEHRRLRLPFTVSDEACAKAGRALYQAGLRTASEQKPSSPESDEAGAREAYYRRTSMRRDMAYHSVSRPLPRWSELDSGDRASELAAFRFARDIGRAEKAARIAELEAELREARAKIVAWEIVVSAAIDARATMATDASMPWRAALARVGDTVDALPPEHRPGKAGT